MSETSKLIKKKKSADYYQKNKDRVLERTKQYALAHPEQVKATQHRHYLANRDKIRAQAKQYAANQSPEKKADQARKKREYRATHRKEQLIVDRRYSAKYKYGLSLEQLDYIGMIQDYRCAICSSLRPGGNGTWHIDHDHKCCPGKRSCGKCIRGLLCSSCNLRLLPYVEHPNHDNALAYLDRHEKIREELDTNVSL